MAAPVRAATRAARAHVSRAVFLGLQPLEAREAAVWLRWYRVRHSRRHDDNAPAPLPPTSFALRACYALSGLVFWLGVRRVRAAPLGDPRQPAPFVSRHGCSRVAASCDASSSRARPRSSPRPYMERTFPATSCVRVCASSNPALLETAAPPRPVVLAAGHQCNFEWMLLRVSADLGAEPAGVVQADAQCVDRSAASGDCARGSARNCVPAKSVLRELATISRGPGHRHRRGPGAAHEPGEALAANSCTRTRRSYMGPEMLGRALRSQVAYVSMRRVARGCVRDRTAAAERAGRETGERASSPSAMRARSSATSVATPPAGGGRTGAGSCSAPRNEHRGRRSTEPSRAAVASFVSEVLATSCEIVGKSNSSVRSTAPG